tara:strand:- start:198 stop:599 length:402 start_codon:yes stop_codon:yes gene_type:complete
VLHAQGGRRSLHGICKFSLINKHGANPSHEIAKKYTNSYYILSAEPGKIHHRRTSNPAPTQATQRAAKAALNKEHAENGNDVTTGKKTREVNEGKTVRRHEDKHEKKTAEKKEQGLNKKRFNPGDKMERQKHG